MESSFDDLSLFVSLVRAGSLVSLSQREGVPLATISRRLKKLEQRLGVTLIYRSAWRFQLSQAGEAYYQAFAQRMDDWDNALQQLQQQNHELSGPLTLSASSTLSIGPLRPVLRDFVCAYPDIELNMLLTNQIIDLQAKQVDLAVRIGPQADSGLTQQRLGQVSTGLFIGQGLAQTLRQAGTLPEHPRELHEQRLIVFEHIPVWRMSDGAQQMELRPKPATQVSNIVMASELVASDMGIALLPFSEMGPALAAGQVEPLLPNWRGPMRDIFAVWPDGKLLTARARRLRDFLRERMALMPELQGQMPVVEGR
ncbi:LysR family transcriptional regulator [Bacterioplanes sanyensis]|uniref:LysR family transcriptional regulator n=1 Tax=Bacterioplanes sanyensis TaxID=1249553 RepID=A0A222FJX8_9GAMM|nr:LysR family transcriptional regulator [Bacterioplanes sanyensis]ASP39049.1 LysR family transcriptional regulator [Bacterioplanes sanyensis]